mmetsp:Transcript_8793/g.11486  ORF Transcript_8793/g.11486 Transcript_8793/m.11486 type:complete len:321 (+) Transcript_8793:223-1185(+)
MDDYQNDETMQKLSLIALNSKVNDVTDDNKKMAVQKVLRAMDTFKGNGKVQELACFLLRSLIENLEDWILLEKAVGNILRVMGDHVDEMEIQEQAVVALALMSRNDIGAEILLRKHTYEPAIQLMERHASSDLIQMGSCLLVATLAQREGYRITLMNATVDKILTAMDRFKENPRLQEMACAAIAHMAIDNENKVPLVRNGAADKILYAMDNHMKTHQVQSSACNALNHLTRNQNNCITLMEKGIAKKILLAMDKHKTNADVQQNACLVLRNLAWASESIKRQLYEMNVIVRLSRAVGTHKTNEDVQKYAKEAMQKILSV